MTDDIDSCGRYNSLRSKHSALCQALEEGMLDNLYDSIFATVVLETGFEGRLRFKA
jgi:hypothetical protein